MGQGSLEELVKAHENIELANGPRMPKESKQAEDAQVERNGPKEPTSIVIGQESLKQHEYKPNDHTRSL